VSRALLIDIGSTYTKARLFDLNNLTLLASGRAFTTIETDVSTGLSKALAQLPDWETADYKLACSSAAGGLKIIAIGLVPALTAEAARRAALGAGSKVLATYSYQLTGEDINNIIKEQPDIILLAGGTDGGNQEVILHNARLIAASNLKQPILVAGNRNAQAKVANMLTEAGKEIYLTENVMPRLEELNIKPAREQIREIFLEKIIKAKGLDRVNQLIDGVIMPTPAAVLEAAALLADGTEDEPGLGELLVVDIGGATTDLHSIATGNPTDGAVNWQGLEEPYQKRTVEGDLGMRYSAPSLVQVVGEKKLKRYYQEYFSEPLDDFALEEYLAKLHNQPAYLAQTAEEINIDSLLGRLAARLATQRHVGQLKTTYTPMGAVKSQTGKDLTKLKTVIGTGGVIVNHEQPDFILAGTSYQDLERPELLAPLAAEYYLDQKYLLAATGLLAGVAPDKALALLKKYLLKL